MQQSSFAFFRGSAALMASDLATTPATEIHVQGCGDCHVANFGGFASPERRLLFDINDFDETLPAPWEWDVKRLAASVVLASRELSMSGRHCSEAVTALMASYRTHMREYAPRRARTGDAAMIGGYLGKTDTFDAAIGSFANGYADQTDQDYTATVKALRSGRLAPGALAA
jgi:uncharacterized protein (DUF2252 family)